MPSITSHCMCSLSRNIVFSINFPPLSSLHPSPQTLSEDDLLQQVLQEVPPLPDDIAASSSVIRIDLVNKWLDTHGRLDRSGQDLRVKKWV